jgi:hypothetical protein
LSRVIASLFFHLNVNFFVSNPKFIRLKES